MASRIVISGLGTVTPLGMTSEEIWPSLMAGACALRPVTRFSTSNLRSHHGGEVDEARLLPHLPSERFRRLPRLDQMIAAAFRLCLQDASRGTTFRLEPPRVGIFLGTARGPLESVEPISMVLGRGRPRDVDPLKFQQTVLNAPLGHLSLHYRITGPCICFGNGNTSAFDALDTARAALWRDQIDIAFVGGGDSLTEGYYRALGDLRVLSPVNGGPESCAPFHRDRNGIGVAEGAAFVALEREESCRSRGGAARGVLEGVGICCDAHSYYGNDPTGDGGARCIEAALSDAGLRRSGVDVLLAGASGDRRQDLAEMRAMARLWNGELPRLPVVALKARFGDMGAASAVAALAVATMIIAQGVVPPTPESDPVERPFALEVPRIATPRPCRRALVQDVAWGGLNGVALVASADAGTRPC